MVADKVGIMALGFFDYSCNAEVMGEEDTHPVGVVRVRKYADEDVKDANPSYLVSLLKRDDLCRACSNRLGREVKRDVFRCTVGKCNYLRSALLPSPSSSSSSSSSFIDGEGKCTRGQVTTR